MKSSKKPCSGPALTVTERHNRLRQGREEEFVVALCSPQLPADGCGAEANSRQTEIVPLAFGIDPPQGLTIRYRDGRKYRPLVRGTPVRLRRGSGLLFLKINAGPDAPIGVQKLRANFMFQRVEPGKSMATEQIAVDFQVVITGHDTEVTESDWPFGSHVGRHLKQVALAPLVPFEILLFVIVCSTSACDL